MSDILEPQKGIFEFSKPQEMDAEKWMNEHLDCDAIVDDLGSTLIVYAFTKDPKYNYDLNLYKKEKKFDDQNILIGISSDGLNSLFGITKN